MNVHEFQAKSLFAQFGVPVPRGKEITSPDAATAWADELNTPVFVVKAQIHAGGRGKAGGVKITKDKAAVAGLAEELIGKTLVTHQTGPKGRQVHRLLMEEGANIAKELYLSHPCRSRYRLADLHCQHRRRNGNRRGRGSYTGEDHQGSD